MSRDLCLTLRDASVQLLPKVPYVTFGKGSVDRGLLDYLELEEHPTIRAVLTNEEIFERQRNSLTEGTGFTPDRFFGYLSILNSSCLDVNLCLPEVEASQLIRQIKRFIGKSVEFSVELNGTDFVDEKWRDGTNIRRALIDGPFSFGVSSKD